jgi:hypothetical protein
LVNDLGSCDCPGCGLRVPPPIFWAQNPCFLWFTGMVAL